MGPVLRSKVTFTLVFPFTFLGTLLAESLSRQIKLTHIPSRLSEANISISAS